MAQAPKKQSNAEPVFSVITVIYNNVEFVRTAIDSVLAQDYPHIQHVIIDGGSTDGTLDILEEYRDRIAVLISEPDDGLYDALNKGIRHATGDIIGFLHADDLFASERAVSQIVEGFAQPGIKAVYGDVERFKNNDPTDIFRYWKGENYTPAMLGRGWMPPHVAFYAYREVYEALGEFDCSYAIAADYEWLLRFLVSEHAQMNYVPTVFVQMREGGVSNASLKNMLRKSREDYRALKTNGVGGIRTLLWKNLRKIPQFISH